MRILSVIGLLLLMANTCFAADNFSGDWFNASYSVKLAVSGQSVSGSFTRIEDSVAGTIQGKLLEDGKAAQLTFNWNSEAGAVEFGVLLYPASKGRLLTGQRWDSSEVLTSFSLRKKGQITQANLPDEDTDFEIATPPDATDPPVITDNPVKPDPIDTTMLPTGTPQVIFDNSNLYAVENGATAPTQFTLAQARWVTSITNYHWNNGQGAAPGKIGIAGPDGARYGPWNATGLPGMGNRPNCSWEVKPQILLPAGTYTIKDSDTATWSQNAATDGMGITNIQGLPATSADEPLSITPTDDVDEPLSITPDVPDADPDISATPEEMALLISETIVDDKPVNPATSFSSPKILYCWTKYNDQPDNTTLICIWVRDGNAVTQTEQIVSGSGWMWFSLSTTSQNGLTKGKYAVKIRSGETVIGYQDFVVE